MLTLDELCKELQSLQRQRAVFLKSRIMVSNRIVALVTGTLGYSSGLKPKEREAKFAEGRALIKAIRQDEVASDLHGLVMTHQLGIDEFNRQIADTEKEMRKMAGQLPIADWVQEPDQKGFGILFLAIVIGETGNLSNYANPGKVWRRMGCAPFTSNDKTLMGATWRAGKEGKLHASEWEEFGYSPRRRSIAYLIGEGIVKQNGEGPYRKRYDEAKAAAAESHPEWIRCSKCDGTGRKGKAKCSNCKGTGQVWLRCHRHGMLLATKRLLRELWTEWKRLANELDRETETATASEPTGV